MRRLTDAEMGHLQDLARRGRTGPARALEALWDLVLREADGVGVAEAAARPARFHVQDYAIAADQAESLLEAMTRRRRLPRSVLAGVWMLWADQSPAEYGQRAPREH